MIFQVVILSLVQKKLNKFVSSDKWQEFVAVKKEKKIRVYFLHNFASEK